MGTPAHRRRWRLGTAVTAIVMVATGAPAVSDSLLPSLDPLPTSPHIVMSTSVADAHTLVTGVLEPVIGGSIVEDLPLVNGVLANLTTTEVAALEAVHAKVTPDMVVRTTMVARPGGGGTGGGKPTTASGNVFREVTHASSVAQTGAGVGVAVVDTGIAPLADFGTRLKPGVDLSGGGGDGRVDTYGHGTFVAGLIAGDGASSKGKYVGEAPGANLYPVKVAGDNGQSNISTVIKGLEWVDARLNEIRVVNMSLGAIVPRPTALNPLDQAVEAMWRHGFVVVTSAGNMGPQQGTITSPGDDPLVITVGALNDAHTVATSDDTVADFSSRGPTAWDGWWKPDLLAPGKSVVSVVPTTSTIWNSYKSARVGKANFIGSGTSFAAAITSGAAAMLVQENPGASPSNVKAALLTTTNAGPAPPAQDPFAQGHGVLDVARAIAEPLIDITQDLSGLVPVSAGTSIPLLSTQVISGWADVDGLTSIGYPAPYSGDAVADPFFESTAWNSTAWNSTAWNSTAWNSTAWNSTAWNSTAWNSTAWNSTAWN